MSELSPEERVRRAERAQKAIEEFFDPALSYVHATFTERLKKVCASEPWETGKIAALANAVRIVEELGSDIKGYIHDGEEAASKLIRVERYEKMSPARRRFISFAPF